MRANILARLRFGSLQFVMEMMRNDWGPEDPILDQALVGAFDENISLAWWLFCCARAADNSVAIDVGAYSGIYSLVAARSRSDLRVVAFEPSAVTWGRLVRNIHLSLLDGQILAANLAAWSHEEIIRLNHAYGLYTLCPGESALQVDNIDHSTKVEAVPLDVLVDRRENLPSYLNTNGFTFLPAGNVAAIKIDVEGAEPAVLEGAIKLLKSHRPMVVCEALTATAQNELRGFLGNLGYDSIDLLRERNLLFLPRDTIAQTQAEFLQWSKDQEFRLSAELLSFNLIG